jgi:arylformamidase
MARVADLPGCERAARRRDACRSGLLSGRVVIFEGLNLSDVEPGMYDPYCLPLRVAGGDGAPARVILKR